MGDWYEVSKDLNIYGVNLTSKNYLGTWKLGSYGNYLFLSGEYMVAQEIIAASDGDGFTRPQNPLEPVNIKDPVFIPSLEEEQKQLAGCYENSPLRYGDIDSDGAKELILFLSKDFIIFSPTLKKIAFAAHYFRSDEMTAEEVESLEIKHDGEDDPALLAGSMLFSERIGKGGLFAAQRSISKMYIGHFLAADSNDIILWRKLYQSRLNKDPVKGFEKLGDVYVHYKLINGEYQKQATPEETIKGWLAAKQLTWQKGYPSKSECSGQEGQLIPEMHDPLLNDPDVLQ